MKEIKSFRKESVLTFYKKKELEEVGAFSLEGAKLKIPFLDFFQVSSVNHLKRKKEWKNMQA